MGKNYLDKKGNCIGSDCYYCGKPVYFKNPHITIPGPIYQFACMKCGKK